MMKKTKRRLVPKQGGCQADLRHLDKTGYHFRDAYYFEGLTASEARALLTGYPNIDSKDVENFSPTAEEMVKIAEEYKGTLIGYVIPVETKRRDSRINITGFTISVSKDIAKELRRRLKPASFHKTADGYRFWWD